MLHAILGPALTEDLIKEVSASGLKEGTLVELTASLQELQVRKYSEMLLLMASAAHATGVAGGAINENEFPLLKAGYADAGKQFGWEVVEALRRFGVDPSSDRESYNRWLQYAVEDLDLHWREVSPDPEEDESESGASTEEDFWKELNAGQPRMSLIGAHLSPIRGQLADYLRDLEKARKHLNEDLGDLGDLGWPISQSIDNAIGNVRVALQLVEQAQDAIVSVFPT